MLKYLTRGIFIFSVLVFQLTDGFAAAYYANNQFPFAPVSSAAVSGPPLMVTWSYNHFADQASYGSMSVMPYSGSNATLVDPSEDERKYAQTTDINTLTGSFQNLSLAAGTALAPSIGSTSVFVTLNSHVMNQGSLKKCTSFSIIELLQSVHFPRRFSQADLITLAAARLQTCGNTGMTIDLGMQIVRDQGVREYTHWPQDIYLGQIQAANTSATSATAWNVCVTPPANIDYQPRFAFKATENLFAVDRMACMQGKGGCVVDKTKAIRAALAKYGSPVSVSIPVKHDDWRTASHIYKAISGKEDGWHAITIYGFDLTDGSFSFKNSWGSEWGVKGYGTMTFSFIETYASEGWVGYGPLELPPLKTLPAPKLQTAGRAAGKLASSMGAAPLPALYAAAAKFQPGVHFPKAHRASKVASPRSIAAYNPKKFLSLLTKLERQVIRGELSYSDITLAAGYQIAGNAKRDFETMRKNLDKGRYRTLLKSMARIG